MLKWFKMFVVPPGIEPGSRVSETPILSVVLQDQWGQRYKLEGSSEGDFSRVYMGYY